MDGPVPGSPVLWPLRELKHVTILFADLAGYTAYAARLEPEDLREVMETLVAGWNAIIITHGGLVEKNMGDATMAVFGSHRSREEDPAEAVRAALAMQAWMSRREAGRHPPALQLRIGIHTGQVVVGPALKTGEFLATGDPVNLAKRLEEHAPAGGVLISRETYHQVFGFFDVQPMPLRSVKGKAEPVETYLVLRGKPPGLAAQMRGIEGVETEMVGRRPELERLLRELNFVWRERTARFALVTGEAGMGKSRLLVEFNKKVELLPQNFRLFCGRATPEMANRPFALFRELFAARFEIHETDPAMLARDKYVRGFTDLLAQAAAGPVEEWLADIQFTGQLLGLDFSASLRLGELPKEAGQIRPRAFEAFGRLLAAMSLGTANKNPAWHTPILMVLEDLHWSDAGSLDLIDHLMARAQNVPLMILGAARPVFLERHPGWSASRPACTALSLPALSVAESQALVEDILRPARDIPPALSELLTENAEGNPYFIEEMIKMLMDQGVIRPGEGEWEIKMSRLAGTRVPATLTGVLQARLDGLTLAERRVLQRASVVGRVFWDSAVEHMSATDPAEPLPPGLLEGVISPAGLGQALKDLRAKELVFRRDSSAFAGASEYIFRHELLRNVAYESLLKKSRRRHHARMAEWLKTRCTDRLLEFAPLIATHYEHAAQLADAAEWHGHAGQQARLAHSPAAAIDHFQRALALLPGDLLPASSRLRQQLAWQEGLVETLGAQARFAEAREAVQGLRGLARQLADPLAEARAWNHLAYLHERQGENHASIECAEQAEALAPSETAAGRAERIRALLTKGWAYYRLADANAVLDLGGRLHQLCTEQGDHQGTAFSFKLLGVAHLQLGHYAEADRLFAAGLALFAEAGDHRETAAMWSNRGEAARARGDCQAAVELYEPALAIARKIGHRDSELIYLTNLSAARLGIRQFEQAEADLRLAIRQMPAQNSCLVAEAWAFLSAACLCQGRPAEAAEAARQAIQLARLNEDPLSLGEAWRALGKAAAAGSGAQTNPAITDPAHCFAESLGVFREIHALGEQARTLRAWAEYEWLQGNEISARKKLSTAHGLFQRLGVPLEVAATEQLLRTIDAGR